MNTRQERFVKELAKFLTANEVEMSLKLEMGSPDAKRWSALRGTTPLFGYYNGEDGLAKAEEELTEFLKGTTQDLLDELVKRKGVSEIGCPDSEYRYMIGISGKDGDGTFVNQPGPAHIFLVIKE